MTRGARFGLAACLIAAVPLVVYFARWRPEPVTPVVEAPVVKFSGCASFSGGACALGPERTLILWVEDRPGSSARVVMRGAPDAEPSLADGGGLVEGGTRYDLIVPEGTSEIAVEVEHAESWRLQIRADDRPSWYHEAVRLRRAGELGAVRAILELHCSTGPTFERALCAGELARVMLREGDREHAIASFRESLPPLEADARYQELNANGTALAYVLMNTGDIAGARAVLSALPPPAADRPSELDGDVLFVRAALEMNVGNLRGALDVSMGALRYARRVGTPTISRFMIRQHVDILLELGRVSEAVAIAADPAPGGDVCEHSRDTTLIGWTRLVARESGVAAPDPLPPLLEALAVQEAASGRCAFGPELVANAHVNLAFAYLITGRAADALTEIERARAAEPRPPSTLRLWSLDIEGRAALDMGDDASAEARFLELDALAVAAGSTSGRWRAALGLARTHEARGEIETSVAMLETSEDLLDALGRAVPVQSGRELFLAQREQGTRMLLDALVRAGRERDAMQVARRSRTRVLRDLFVAERIAHLEPEARARWDHAMAAMRELEATLEDALEQEWSLPREQRDAAREHREALHASIEARMDEALAELPPAPLAAADASPDVVTLLYHPSREGWLGFALRGDRLVVHRFDAPPSDAFGDADVLMAPFAALLADVGTVRVLAHGSVRAIDFAAGVSLGDRVAVVQGLDMPRRAPSTTRHALLVADPDHDLPRSRAEVEAIRSRLEDAGWTTEVLIGDDATREAVLEALPRASLFHYAGHASASDATDRDSWDGALVLARSTRFEVGDVLSLSQAPDVVVLSACSTLGAPSIEGPESATLAYAFVLAGAQSVIAAARAVTDDGAAAIALAFHERLVRGMTPVDALHDISHPERGSFRVIVP